LAEFEDVFLAVWLTGMLLTWPPWIWFSINSRRTRGEPLVPRPPTGAAFCELRASGRAHGTLLGRASNCLMVAIAGDELWITPTFPFNLVAPYGLMGLEYRIPKRTVTVVETSDSLFGPTVVIDIPRPNAPSRRVALKLTDRKAFLATLNGAAAGP
jgi:hypothetical protein